MSILRACRHTFLRYIHTHTQTQNTRSTVKVVKTMIRHLLVRIFILVLVLGSGTGTFFPSTQKKSNRNSAKTCDKMWMANDVLFQVLRFIFLSLIFSHIRLHFSVAHTNFVLYLLEGSIEVLWRFPCLLSNKHCDYGPFFFFFFARLIEMLPSKPFPRRDSIWVFVRLYLNFSKFSRNRDEKCKQYYINILDAIFCAAFIRKEAYRFFAPKTYAIASINWPIHQQIQTTKTEPMLQWSKVTHPKPT